MTHTVEVYRLWSDGSWDKVAVEVLADPWNEEIVESRAVTSAWLSLALQEGHRAAPIQIGLLMESFFHVNPN